MSRRIPLLACAVALALLAGFAVQTRAASFSLDGYVKSFASGYDMPQFSADDLPPMGALSNRVRLNGSLRLSPSVQFDLSYGPQMRIQDALLFSSSVTAIVAPAEFAPYRIDDLNRQLFPERGIEIRSFVVYQDLDRAYLTVRTEHFDFYLGRQPIAWGTARIVNPTDIIAPYAYTELDTEDRVGVDAARVRVPLGFMGELDFGYVAGPDAKWENSAAFVRAKGYLAGTDFSGLACAFRENLLLGCDLARAIGGAGTWLEAGYVMVGAAAEGRRDEGHDYLRLSVGADYSPADGLYTFAEYHYNEAGSSNRNDYFSFLSTAPGAPAYAEGAVYLRGKHYLTPGLSYQITPLLIGTAEVVTNLNDPSALVSVTGEYNFAENVYLAAGMYVGAGPSLRMGRFMQFDWGSEFGNYPDTFWSSFRVYF